MKYLYILLFLILLNAIPAKAQNCGYYHIKDEQIESITEGYIQQNQHRPNLRAVIKIPVVVHVVWKNTLENISDAQIQSQIDVLNQDFRKKNTDFKDVPGSFKTVAADCEIEFCLASKDTLGNPTTGIVRQPTTIPSVGVSFSGNKRRIYYKTLEGSDAWKPDTYLNIWVCDMGNNILGYTSPLANAVSKYQEDGVLVDYRVFGTIGTALNNTAHNKGRTATHEIGHYFNLLHIWGTDDSCNDDDLVIDTPLQATSYKDCPPFPQLSCNVGNMYMNFMDYTDDNCMGLFTNGQKARMLATLNELRSGLLRGGVCSETSSLPTSSLSFNWSVYPNPVQEQLNIQLSYFNNNISTPINIEIRDLLGRVLKRETVNSSNLLSHSMDLTSFPDGVYLVVLTQNNQISIKRIIKTAP